MRRKRNNSLNKIKRFLTTTPAGVAFSGIILYNIVLFIVWYFTAKDNSLATDLYVIAGKTFTLVLLTFGIFVYVMDKFKS